MRQMTHQVVLVTMAHSQMLFVQIMYNARNIGGRLWRAAINEHTWKGLA